MPKKTEQIPEWIREKEYPTHLEPEEFAYQIFIRKSAFNTWKIAKRHVGQDGAKANIQLILAKGFLRESFDILKTFIQSDNQKTKPILSRPTLGEVSLGSLLLSPEIKYDHIPNGMPIIGINLKHTDEEILDAVSKHLKELRMKNLPIKPMDKISYSERDHTLLNDIYMRPNFYLKKWTEFKALQAFDLALWRQVTGNRVTVPEIVRHLELQDADQWRKTTLKKAEEIMIPGITESILCGLNR